MNEAVLRNAQQQHRAGNLAEAARLYGEAVRANPADVDALSMLGHVYVQSRQFDAALRVAEEAIGISTGSSTALYKLGCLFQTLGRHDDALLSYDKALALKPDYLEAFVHRGLSLLAQSKFDQALLAFDTAAILRPGEPGIWNNRGNALVSLGRAEDALLSYDKALALNPSYPEAWEGRGLALCALARYDEALSNYDKALRIRPRQPRTWRYRVATLLTLQRHEAALAECDRVLGNWPGDVQILVHRATALMALKRPGEALTSLDAALALEPSHAEALFLRANALLELKHCNAALAALDACLAIKPNHAGALTSRAAAFLELWRLEEAVASCDAALAIVPDSTEALVNRGTALFELKRYEEATRDYEKALATDSGLPYLAGTLAAYRLHRCDWRGLEDHRKTVAAGLREGKRIILPFANLMHSHSPAGELRCARIWQKNESPASPSPLWRGENYRHDRIRLAYVSADFFDHAVANLIGGVFEQHDRARFETIAVSFSPDDGSQIRQRIAATSDRFIDVSEQSEAEIAALLRQLEIDIAIDLKALTHHHRCGIFALRPAPVQVNYLGYPGTMGADYIDYILADETVIPPEHRPHYSEAVVYLPDTYQCNDFKRPIAEHTPTRAEAFLPQSGFVFCCFNASFKITPEIFDIWMRLLRETPGSVLWLLENSEAARNLKREAQARGVAPERLVFAPRMKAAEHLARHRLADLFLDTLPYGAHTTASDALWSGLPVVTCLGTTFAGRVGASLLRAAGLPELVTGSPEAYEALALKLAREPATLARIKAKLARDRGTLALFDTRRMTRNLEAAYHEMWERRQRGEAPAHFTVARANPS